MNGLALRISGSVSRKTRNTFGFDTVTIPEKYGLHLGTTAEEICSKQKFLGASTVEEQLTQLKDILNSLSVTPDTDSVRFLVLVFLEAEVKHPVKCFLMRYITKSDSIQLPFSEVLSKELASLILAEECDHRVRSDVVGKLLACVENFPPGAVALIRLEVELAQYLNHGLGYTVRTLRENQSLSPTEKNELFNLAHSVLRLILYILQKHSPENVAKLTPMFSEIRSCLKELLFDDDVPMDTKSVCGIVFVTMHIAQNGPDSWVDILKGEGEELQEFLGRDASRLALLSGAGTAAPAPRLHALPVGGAPAIVALVDTLLAIGDRTTSESTFNLAIARTLAQVSKSLERVADKPTGLQLVSRLLGYVWATLDHCMDSVRHLSAQALASVVRYCARLQREGDSSAIDDLFAALQTLDRSRRSFYVTLTALAAELGAGGVLARMPGAVAHVLGHLHAQPVQASATTTLETLLAKRGDETASETYERWVAPIVAHAARAQPGAAELGVLEGLLAKIVKADEGVMSYIVPHIKQSREHGADDLRCVLMLLGVARRAGVVGRLGVGHAAHEWRGVLAYDALREAAVSSVEQNRILALSLVVECPKSTEAYTAQELELVLFFLRWNANAQAPNFRQNMLSLMKKFMKRFEDSYKVLTRSKDLEGCCYYEKFLERLREQCFDSLVAGASYGRRRVALQLLVWWRRARPDVDSQWRVDHVGKLLARLEDSYEDNKALALELLLACPAHLLRDKKFSDQLELTAILRQASSVKPTACVSAAYKLRLLRARLADNVLEGEHCVVPEAVSYVLLRRLVRELARELAVCRASVVAAARDAPVYGLVHCAAAVVDALPAEAIAESVEWRELIAELVAASLAVSAAVAGVVSSASPEGHLPMDLAGVSDHGNDGNVTLEDGRPVTAQMVLLCAWRSVKEVSLLLGSMCSRLAIGWEGGGSLSAAQLLAIGDHFTTLLAETKHRGAFEQAYVGFTSLLTRLWRCRNAQLHALPAAWLAELMAAIRSPGGRLCATRRSAGLPFMIQALVTTELQVRGNPACLQSCTAALLRLAGAGERVQTRTHCLNILRALVRTAALQDAVAPHVGRALRVALDGFEGSTWEERNSSTLLFSALMVRVFGVQRSRDWERLCARNRMTGRVFFLRYPDLYDYMLGKLEEVSSSSDAALLRPSLYPVLLLLARLYPSSLEGTASNLKLVSFVPHVVACARSGVLQTRRLAARAVVPLISHEQYIPHLDAMLALLSDATIKRNFCHGILLQIVRLLENMPEGLALDEASAAGLSSKARAALWTLRQARGPVPCYVVADECLRMLNLLLWRYPTLLSQDVIDGVRSDLDTLLFEADPPRTAPGREVCLADAASLYCVILSTARSTARTARTARSAAPLCELVFKCLAHHTHEVVLSALNFILILYKDLEVQDKFQEHLSTIPNEHVLDELVQPMYFDLLCSIIKYANECLECNQKALKILTLIEDTQDEVVQSKENEYIVLTEDVILERLFHYIDNEHENLTHIYLKSLADLLGRMLRSDVVVGGKMLDAIRVVFACSSSYNSDATRKAVVDFLDANIERLFDLDLDDLLDADKFEFNATLNATLVTMLEDDDAALGQRAADVIARAIGAPRDVIPARCAAALRAYLAADEDGAALLAALALLDFKADVLMTDDGNEECRVFDQNERHNVHLEETIWSRACARAIRRVASGHEDLVQYVLTLSRREAYAQALDRLCGTHLAQFRAACETSEATDNPKVQLFIDELRSTSELCCD